jgi:hypothetical protein
MHLGKSEIRDVTEGDDGPMVWKSGWDRAYVTSSHAPGLWTSEAARKEAHSDVAQSLAARLMNIPEKDVPDAPDKLGATLRAFEELLDRNPREEDVQVFLANNPVVIEPTAVAIHPKVKLGTEYVTDFVIQLGEGEYVLVEIEPPGSTLYTLAGNPSAHLNHAQKQVEDWREWVSENISYARQSLPGITEPYGRVIMGRRASLTQRTAKALRRRNQELHHLKIETFDDLISRVRLMLGNIQSH